MSTSQIPTKGNVAFGVQAFLNLPSKMSRATIKICIKQGAIYGENQLDENAFYCQVWDCNHYITFTSTLDAVGVQETTQMLENMIDMLQQAVSFIAQYEAENKLLKKPQKTASDLVAGRKKVIKYKNPALDIRKHLYSPTVEGRASIQLNIPKDTIWNASTVPSKRKELDINIFDKDESSIKLHNSLSIESIENAKYKINALKDTLQKALDFINQYINESL